MFNDESAQESLERREIALEVTEDPLSLQLLEEQQVLGQQYLRHQRLSLIFGFILAVMALIAGSLIVLLHRELLGAIAGLSVITLGMIAFWLSQWHLKEPIHKL
ncbi:MAG: hypothetical protein ACKOX2_18910 [Microcystaceae cyanobacterium]|nr:hypothetical protein [Merismopediaceae bacterium]